MDWDEAQFYGDHGDEYGNIDPDMDIEKWPAEEEIDEPELLDYDDWFNHDDEESEPPKNHKGKKLPEPIIPPPDPDEPLEADTEAERSGKLLRREMKAEALRRMEESARTQKDFEEVLSAWDKQTDNRARTFRNRELSWGDIEMEYGTSNLDDPMVFPTWLGKPLERQLARGNFLECFSHCPYEMQNLSGKEYICEAVAGLKEDHKELLYFMGIQGFSPQQLAAIRDQTDRNIRKVRDTMLRKVQARLYNSLMYMMEKHHYHPTHREEDFMTRYEAEMEVTENEAV